MKILLLGMIYYLEIILPFQYVRRNGPEGNYLGLAPTEFFADTSELYQLLKKGHHGVEMPQDVVHEKVDTGGKKVHGRSLKELVETVRAIRKQNPDAAIELLIPDLDARPDLLDVVIASKPGIIGHNIETVERPSA